MYLFREEAQEYFCFSEVCIDFSERPLDMLFLGGVIQLKEVLVRAPQYMAVSANVLRNTTIVA